MKRIYLDSSAFVKLVVSETESEPLRKWIRGRPWTSSTLLTAEVLRAARVLGPEALERARHLIARGELLRLSPRVMALSAMIGPTDLRTLDAIHLATATLLRDQLAAVVSYDHRLTDAARSLKMRVAAPI